MIILKNYIRFFSCLLCCAVASLGAKAPSPVLGRVQQQKDTSKSKLDALKQSIAAIKTTTDRNAAQKMRTDSAASLGSSRVSAYAYSVGKRYSDYFDAKEQLEDDKNDLDKLNLDGYASLNNLNLVALVADNSQAKKNVDSLNTLADRIESPTADIIKQAQALYDDTQNILSLKKLNEIQATIEKIYADRIKAIAPIKARKLQAGAFTELNKIADDISSKAAAILTIPVDTAVNRKKAKDAIVALQGARSGLKSAYAKVLDDDSKIILSSKDLLVAAYKATIAEAIKARGNANAPKQSWRDEAAAHVIDISDLMYNTTMTDAVKIANLQTRAQRCQVLNGNAATTVFEIPQDKTTITPVANLRSLIPDLPALSQNFIRSLTQPQIQALSKEQVDDYITSMLPEQIGFLTIDQIAQLNSSKLTAAQIAALSVQQLKIIDLVRYTPEQFPGINPAYIAGLTGTAYGQAAALVGPQVAAMTDQQLAAFNGGQLAGLKPESTRALKLDKLTPDQLRYVDHYSLSPAQIKQLPATILQSFTLTMYGKMSGMKPEWIINLLPEQLQAFTPAQISFIPGATLKALTPAQLTVLTLDQQKALTNDQKAALSNEQLAALTKIPSQAAVDNAFNVARQNWDAVVNGYRSRPVSWQQLAANERASLDTIKNSTTIAMADKITQLRAKAEDAANRLGQPKPVW